jgi:hypothetical protein
MRISEIAVRSLSKEGMMQEIGISANLSNPHPIN